MNGFHLNLNKLEVLREAARSGNYTAAAERLHLTPSAVSHAIRKLEAGLGRSLVEWRGRRLALTDDGEYLYRVCERVFGELDEAAERLARSEGGIEKAVVLGANVEFGSHVLIRKLRPLLEAHPELRVDFLFSHELTQPLLRDEIDLAVDCRPHQNPAVESISLFREKYAVVAAPSFLKRNPVSTPRDLERLPVLSLDKEGAWWRNMLEAVPQGGRPVFRRVIAVNHIRGMINAAAEGLGVALTPKYAVLDDLARGRLRVVFPGLKLLEDRFCVFQKRARAGREKNRLLTRFLTGMTVGEFGDAIGRAPRRGP
ncbi:MAG: LysR family transcriptional regulator [Elusimicrobia bacterium]|nr:LysR family transcriptional regulator [Elusimicrobiota bacterium]